MPTDSGSVAAVRSLRKIYPGGMVALDDIDLELGANSITALTGPNGSGKTTLLRILAGSLAPTSGTVVVLGVDPAANSTWLRRRVGFISQEVALDPEMTGAQTLRLFAVLYGVPGRKMAGRIDQLAQSLELTRHLAMRVQAYSGGLRRRLHLALGLLHEPQLLLLDEPTTGLDPAGMRDMRDLVRRLAAEGITILLSSHLLYEVEELCNRVAIIRKGRIVYQGALRALLATATSGYRLRALDPDRARAALVARPRITDVRLHDGDLRFTADEEEVAALTVALGQAEVAFTALVPETASLEELFLGMTDGDSADRDRPAAVAV